MKRFFQLRIIPSVGADMLLFKTSTFFPHPTRVDKLICVQLPNSEKMPHYFSKIEEDCSFLICMNGILIFLRTFNVELVLWLEFTQCSWKITSRKLINNNYYYSIQYSINFNLIFISKSSKTKMRVQQDSPSVGNNNYDILPLWLHSSELH